jgi:hypothetical protein
MDLTLWRSGNFAAAARFGLWNPLTVFLDVALLQIDDLALATFLAALIYLLLLVIGLYPLAREYGATAWCAALSGVVVVADGWTLWMDAAWWIPQVASLASRPFVWVAARRLARGVDRRIWFVVNLLSQLQMLTCGSAWTSARSSSVAVQTSSSQWTFLPI